MIDHLFLAEIITLFLLDEVKEGNEEETKERERKEKHQDT